MGDNFVQYSTGDEGRARLQKIKMYVLDMDGTIYLGDRLFPFTQRFLSTVRAKGADFCFFTNNSSRNREAYLQKLAGMGIEIPPEKMLISNGVLLDWLRAHHPGESAYVVGTPALCADFDGAGIQRQEDADYVVLGFDTTLTYEKLVTACDLVRAGKPIYGVNPDLNCPVEGGFIPDCGSMAALVKASTGVGCEFFGKPSRHTLSYMLAHTGGGGDRGDLDSGNERGNHAGNVSRKRNQAGPGLRRLRPISRLPVTTPEAKRGILKGANP